MSHITIKIETDNAAFENLEIELPRILRDLADRAEDTYETHYLVIHDVNGNKVGELNYWGDS